MNEAMNSQPAAPKDPNTVFLIELVGGLFGFLGLGYFYVGRMNDGAIRLILYLIYNIISAVIITFLSGLTVGVAACVCVPLQLIVHLGVVFWSANGLKNQLVPQPATSMQSDQPKISVQNDEADVTETGTETDASTGDE